MACFFFSVKITHSFVTRRLARLYRHLTIPRFTNSDGVNHTLSINNNNLYLYSLLPYKILQKLLKIISVCRFPVYASGEAAVRFS